MYPAPAEFLAGYTANTIEMRRDARSPQPPAPAPDPAPSPDSTLAPSPDSTLAPSPDSTLAPSPDSTLAPSPDLAPALAGIPALAEAYRILRSRIDFSRLPRFSRDVTERVIDASADFDDFTDLVCDEDSLAEGVAALAAARASHRRHHDGRGRHHRQPGALQGQRAAHAARLSRTASITRAAAAVRLAFGEVGPGAVWVVGGGPAALAEISSWAGRAGLLAIRPARRIRRRGRGQGRAAGLRPAVGQQRVGEGRPGRGRGRL